MTKETKDLIDRKQILNKRLRIRLDENNDGCYKNNDIYDEIIQDLKYLTSKPTEQEKGEQPTKTD